MQMRDNTVTGEIARTAGREWLHDALQRTRARTLALFAAYEKSLPPGVPVPYSPELNPPAWELGHIGWFQEWWLARNPRRAQGAACDLNYAPLPSRLDGADAFYDSSRVPHETRWSLPLPDTGATRRYLQESLAQTLELLAKSPEDDTSLYFFRLALLHEDMHGEAAVYMAQALGLPLSGEAAFPREDRIGTKPPSDPMALPRSVWTLGVPPSQPGFAFDNEHGTHAVSLTAFDIDAAPVTWARFLPFIEAGGYDRDELWTSEGMQWRARNRQALPRYLRKHAGAWQHQVFGTWLPLDVSESAVHLTLHEAQAWCRWAGRRLPTEAEWECAAMNHPDFRWGDVWEWTADAFSPFPGFTPHPYRDYSAPWFASRQVLKGASSATSPHMVHPKYRNFFTSERNDIHSGFRSCGL
jgi:gamma-glutamyl hercynylcysteine S-oxide synthase